jgi:hypothetical protein
MAAEKIEGPDARKRTFAPALDRGVPILDIVAKSKNVQSLDALIEELPLVRKSGLCADDPQVAEVIICFGASVLNPPHRRNGSDHLERHTDARHTITRCFGRKADCRAVIAPEGR